MTRNLARLGMAVFAVGIMVGAALMVAALVDIDLVRWLVASGEKAVTVPLVERPQLRLGLGVVLVAALGLVGSAVVWYSLTELEGGDDVYWWSLEQEVKRTVGEAAPPLEVARAALALEKSRQGWRPETMLRFLHALPQDHLTGPDAELVAEFLLDVRRNQNQLDHLIRTQGANEVALRLSGREYSGIELSELFDTLRSEIRKVQGYTTR